MCGIIGYTGHKEALGELLSGLSKLEYRGYDSAGVAVQTPAGGMIAVKKEGRIKNLSEAVQGSELNVSHCGIGHTRWATHGKPSDVNAHPHRGANGSVWLVHNGIIENFQEIKDKLARNGIAFVSETDTEAASQLLEYEYGKSGSPIAAICETVKQLRGTYAFAILFGDRPGEIYAAKKDSPLLVGLSENETYIASDITAFLNITRRYISLSDGEIAMVNVNGAVFYDSEGNPVSKTPQTAAWSYAAADKGDFPHFMLKEINEQPETLNAVLAPRIRDGMPDFSADGLDIARAAASRRIHITACGSAMHTALYAKSLIEGLARIPVEVDIASEFRYKDPIVGKEDFVYVISQSGETMDTLAALRLVKERGVPCAAIVNVPSSTIAREADTVLLTHAGPEIAVATTKAYSSQAALQALLAIALAYEKKLLGEEETRALTHELCRLSDAAAQIIAKSDALDSIAGRIADAKIIPGASEYNHSVFFLGRGADYAAITEASLKLKEITYIHSEAYAAGELKHGTISLISENVNVVAVATDPALFDKMESNMKSVTARGGYVYLLTGREGERLAESADSVFFLPDIHALFKPITAVIASQIIAYKTAARMGLDIDKPRNLAKSVTVE